MAQAFLSRTMSARGLIRQSIGFEGEVIGRGSSCRTDLTWVEEMLRNCGKVLHISPGEYDIKELSDEAKQWEGWGTALKPAHEPMVLARKPLIGTVAANVMTYGTGGLNIDGARVGNDSCETWPKVKSFPYGQDRTYGLVKAPTELTRITRRPLARQCHPRWQ
jgi:hypothetical protein